MSLHAEDIITQTITVNYPFSPDSATLFLPITKEVWDGEFG